MYNDLAVRVDARLVKVLKNDMPAFEPPAEGKNDRDFYDTRTQMTLGEHEDRLRFVIGEVLSLKAHVTVERGLALMWNS